MANELVTVSPVSVSPRDSPSGVMPWPNNVMVSSLGGLGGSVECPHNRNYIVERHWQASYKGIPFMVDRDEWVGGRRMVTHEFPSRDFWLNEDMGQKAARVQVRGYVYGARVEEWALVLFDACTSYGEQELLLPQRPRMKAVCTDVRSEFTADAQGRINLNMEFVLSLQPTMNTAQWSESATASQVMQAASQLDTESIADIERVTLTSLPPSAYSQAVQEIRSVGRSLRRMIDETPLPSDVSSSLAHLGSVMEREAVAFTYALRQRANAYRPTSLGGGQSQAVAYKEYYDFIAAVQRASGGMGLGAGTAGTQQFLARSLMRWLNLAESVQEFGTSNSSNSVRMLLSAVVRYVRRTAAALQARMLVDVAQLDVQKAEEISSRMIVRLNLEYQQAIDQPQVAMALAALIDRWTRHLAAVRRRRVQIMRLAVYGPLAPTTAILYGGTEIGETEYDRILMERNGIRHPLFVTQSITAPVGSQKTP